MADSIFGGEHSAYPLDENALWEHHRIAVPTNPLKMFNRTQATESTSGFTNEGHRKFVQGDGEWHVIHHELQDSGK